MTSNEKCLTAMRQLVENWATISKNYNQLLDVDYPFDECFDDLLIKVQTWLNTAEGNLDR